MKFAGWEQWGILHSSFLLFALFLFITDVLTMEDQQQMHRFLLPMLAKQSSQPARIKQIMMTVTNMMAIYPCRTRYMLGPDASIC